MMRISSRWVVGLVVVGELIWSVASVASSQAAYEPEEVRPIWVATQMREIFPH